MKALAAKRAVNLDRLSSGSCMTPCVSGSRWGAIIVFHCRSINYTVKFGVQQVKAPNTGQLGLKIKGTGRVWARFFWSEACMLLFILPIPISVCYGVIYPGKPLWGVNWPDFAFYVTINRYHIQDNFSSSGVWGVAELLSCFSLAENTKGCDSSECSWWKQQCFLSLAPKQSQPRACYFCYVEPPP